MSVLLMLLPLALGLGFCGLMAFLWALRSGQFEDLDGAASRILFDDDDGSPSIAYRAPDAIVPPDNKK